MKYFQQLPKLLVTDEKGVSKLYTNIMARASIIDSLLNNPILFYSYDIQDGDTPEIVADKFYGDSYLFWLVMFANQKLDPQWDWPLSSGLFYDYIADKYPEGGTIDPYSSIYQYEKVETKYDSSTQTTTVETFIIDEDTYDNLIPYTSSYTFTSGTTTITVSKNAKTYYQHEVEVNENKRNIKLLRKEYAIQIENEFKTLMSA
jgi:hypothetical protein